MSATSVISQENVTEYMMDMLHLARLYLVVSKDMDMQKMVGISNFCARKMTKI